MARANRYYLPGYAWHITHRCHKQEFLLKFDKDKKRWVYWLYQAKKRFGLCVLNYVVTSNHIHLLVYEEKAGTIPKSLQLLSGRVAQEYNIRKNRKGAFWEDRYHATAVDSEAYLAQCMVYMDLNMVRAGVVNHPEEWRYGGYNEIMNPKKRGNIINLDILKQFFRVKEINKLQEDYKQFVRFELKKEGVFREPDWSKTIAIGSEGFVSEIKENLGLSVQKRKIEDRDNRWLLCEKQASYS